MKSSAIAASLRPKISRSADIPLNLAGSDPDPPYTVNNTGDQGPCLFPAEEQGPRYSKPQSTHDKTALTINAAGLLAVPRRAILRTDSKLLLLRVLGLFSREVTTVWAVPPHHRFDGAEFIEPWR